MTKNTKTISNPLISHPKKPIKKKKVKDGIDDDFSRVYTLEEQEYYKFSHHLGSFLPLIRFFLFDFPKTHPNTNYLFRALVNYMSFALMNSIGRHIRPIEGGQWSNKKQIILHKNFEKYILKNYKPSLKDWIPEKYHPINLEDL